MSGKKNKTAKATKSTTATEAARGGEKKGTGVAGVRFRLVLGPGIGSEAR